MKTNIKDAIRIYAIPVKEYSVQCSNHSALWIIGKVALDQVELCFNAQGYLCCHRLGNGTQFYGLHELVEIKL